MLLALYVYRGKEELDKCRKAVFLQDKVKSALFSSEGFTLCCFLGLGYNRMAKALGQRVPSSVFARCIKIGVDNKCCMEQVFVTLE